MKLFTLTILLIFSFLVGCSSQTRLGDPRYLPDNWFAISTNSWQYRTLPEANKIEFQNLKTKLAVERQGQYYSFYQEFNPETQAEISAVINNLNEAYYNQRYSSKSILANLTPNMHGIAETYSDNDAGIAVVNNANERMIVDDFRRATLLDKPSMLSPYPVVDN